MSEQYTPTELEVIQQYTRSEPPRLGTTVLQREKEIMRFIDQVRREAKVEALKEATTELMDLDPKGDAVFWDGEYYVFVHGWLYERADQLEQKGKNDE